MSEMHLQLEGPDVIFLHVVVIRHSNNDVFPKVCLFSSLARVSRGSQHKVCDVPENSHHMSLSCATLLCTVVGAISFLLIQ